MTEETITYTRKKKNQKNPAKPKVIETLEPIKEDDAVVISMDKAKLIKPKKELSVKQKANVERLVALNKERKLKREADAKDKADEEIKAKAEAEQKEKDDLAKQGLRKVKYIIKPRKKREVKHVEAKPKVSFEEQPISQQNQKDYLQKDDYDYPSETDEDESDRIPSDTTDTKQIKRKVQKIKQLQSAITETKSNPYNDLLKKYY